MNICIIGGGNIGTAMAALISSRGHSVVIKTKRPELWSQKILYTDMETKKNTIGHLKAITNANSAVSEADMILITTPSFLIKEVAAAIIPYVRKETPIGIVPGTGGAEFFFKSLIQKGYLIFGFDRVPCIARINEYGKSVLGSKKKSVRLGYFNCKTPANLCKQIENLLGLECFLLPNYLTVTFTPSNPILHTARLYCLYQNNSEHTWDKNIPFYENWDDFSSELLIACDKELQLLCENIVDLDLSNVIPLTVHYESQTAKELTKKISGITAFQGILSPMVKYKNRFILDVQSRYFTEDFPFGLCILRGFSEIFSIPTPNFDRILLWYQQLCGQKYFTDTGFNGSDLLTTAIPQNFDIHQPKDVYTFYKA